MAAERTPSRRQQCIFRRTLQRFPFGKCERRTGSSSSYDVHRADKPQHPAERWSPNSSSISTLNIHQPGPGEGLDPGLSSRTQQTSMEPSNTVNGMCEDNVVLDHVSVVDHISSLGFSPHRHLPQHNMDSMQVSLDSMGQQDVDSAYSSVSHTEDENQHHLVSPPSPSISSMETDVGVDPETGERAME